MISEVIVAAQQAFALASEIEITLEANLAG